MPGVGALDGSRAALRRGEVPRADLLDAPDRRGGNTHTHHSAAQPGRVSVVSGGSWVETVPGLGGFCGSHSELGAFCAVC